MAFTALADEVLRVISTAVDGAFYRAAYPELDAADLDPIRHYATAGWREGRDPAPWFSTHAYLDANTDVRRAGVEPFYHYLTTGRREGRDVYPSVIGEAYLLEIARRGDRHAWTFQPPRARSAIEAPPPPPIEAASEPLEPLAPAAPPPDMAAADRATAAVEFDAGYYLGANPDVADVGMDPLEHFLQTGWREFRDPNTRFSIRDYLESYPDIEQAGINPFVHYLRSGRGEGRKPRSELGFRYEVVARLIPPDARVDAVKAASAELTLAPATALAKALAESRTGLADLHVTFSHDDYTSNIGGVQLCLQREDARVAELGRDHLHLYPAKPWPVVRTADEAGHLGVIWNGRQIGVYSPKAVAKTLRQAAGKVAPGQRSFAIHSLLGHAADETADIVEAAGLKAGYFWLHDFASLCAGYHLLRNDVQDCAAPPPDSPACGICAYGPWRARHLSEHERLFQRLDLMVVAPSQPTLDLWRRSWRFPTQGEVVLPHAHLVDRGPAPAPRKKRPMRIAYVGMPVAHKGWPIFLDLVMKHGDDDRYTFLHLGSRTPGGLPLGFHEVTVSEAQPRIMQATLEALEVDAVLVWPLCRETFSFTAYEAAAAGAAVITGPDSGNVAAFVAESGHGRVMADEAALAAAFESGAIAELARVRRRPRLYDLKFSAMTVDLLVPPPSVSGTRA